MSRKLLKVLILAAMLSSALLSAASSAPAAVWNSNGSAGGTGFTATAPAMKLTMTGVSAGINCTTTSFTGRLYGPSGTVGTNRVADMVPTFSGCRAGGFTASASAACCGWQWWVNTYNSAVRAVSGAIDAAVATIVSWFVPSISGCVIDVRPTNGTGSAVVTLTYNDGTGTWTIDVTGQAVTVTWSSCGTLFGTAAGSASGTLSNASGGALAIRTTSAFVPNVTI
jgi:hypothetical protein